PVSIEVQSNELCDSLKLLGGGRNVLSGNNVYPLLGCGELPQGLGGIWERKLERSCEHTRRQVESTELLGGQLYIRPIVGRFEPELSVLEFGKLNVFGKFLQVSGNGGLVDIEHSSYFAAAHALRIRREYCLQLHVTILFAEFTFFHILFFKRFIISNQCVMIYTSFIYIVNITQRFRSRQGKSEKLQALPARSRLSESEYP